MSTPLPKLVRDKVPDQIHARGGTPYWHPAGKYQLRSLLQRKLQEEVQELYRAVTREQTLEELADVQEVLDALLDSLGINRDELAAVRAAKLQKAGGFARGVVLRHIEEPDDPA